jgi:hypothetical protein
MNDGFNNIDVEFEKRNIGSGFSSPVVLVYADDVNLRDDNIDTKKKNTEKSKYMLVSCQKNEGKTDDTKISNGYSDKVAQLKYFETTVTNQKFDLRKKLKERLNSGNACYHSVQNLSFVFSSAH